MPMKIRHSTLAHAVCLALTLPLLVGCGRSITSSPGNAPNLEVWAKQVQNKKPTAKRQELPLLKERTVFNYADNTIITLNPNPQAALDAAMANGQQSPSADPSSPPVLELIRTAAKGGKADAALDTAAQKAYLDAWKAAADFFGLNRNDLVAAKSFFDKLDAASSQSGLTGADLTPEQVAAAAAAATQQGEVRPEVRTAPELPAATESTERSEKAKAEAAGTSTPTSDQPKEETPKAEKSAAAAGGLAALFVPVDSAVMTRVSLFAAPQAERRDRRKTAQENEAESVEEVTAPTQSDTAAAPPSPVTLPEAIETLPTTTTAQPTPASEAGPAGPKVSAVDLAKAFSANAYNLRRAGFDLEQSLAFLAASPTLAPGIAQEFALAGPDTNRTLFDLASGRRVSPVDVLILSSNEGRGIDSLPASTAIATFRSEGGATRLKALDTRLRAAGGGEAIRFLLTDRSARKALRNPFDLPAVDEASISSGQAATRPDPNRPRQVLEQFSLDSLRMVGTMGSGSDITALVRAPDRTTYRVRLGQYMGQNEGRVVNIDNGGLDIVELIRDGGNGWAEQPASILLEN